MTVKRVIALLLVLGVVASWAVAQSSRRHDTGTLTDTWYPGDGQYHNETGLTADMRLSWWINGPKRGERSENIGTRVFDEEGFFGFNFSIEIDDDWDYLYYEGKQYEIRELERSGIDVRDSVEISRVTFRITLKYAVTQSVMTLEFTEYVNDGEGRRAPIAMTQGSIHGGRDLEPERIARLMNEHGLAFWDLEIVEVRFRGLRSVASAGDAEDRRESLIFDGDLAMDRDDYTDAISAYSAAQSIRETDDVAQKIEYARLLREQELDRRAAENESEREASSPPVRTQEDINQEAAEAMVAGVDALFAFGALGGYVGLVFSSDSAGLALAYPMEGVDISFQGAFSAALSRNSARSGLEQGEYYAVRNWIAFNMGFNVGQTDIWDMGSFRPMLGLSVGFLNEYERVVEGTFSDSTSYLDDIELDSTTNVGLMMGFNYFAGPFWVAFAVDTALSNANLTLGVGGGL